MTNGDWSPEPDLVPVHYKHSAGFVGILDRLHATLLVSTYQAGKLLVIGVHEGSLAFSFHHFPQVTGVAVHRQQIAVGSQRQIWFLRAAPGLAAHVKPEGKFDGCFIARSAHITGEIQIHEMAWGDGDELWVVNTLFSCLCTLHDEYDFIPRWQPPFISRLAADDRCHLNGLALEHGKPRYVTALAQTDEAAGWRPNKASTGCLIDVPSGATVAQGFAMPHSPRVHHGIVWVLDSGRGQIKAVDIQAGTSETVAEMPGYGRGCAMHGPFAFVGMSRIRQSNVFGGIPIADKRDQLKCGVEVIDLRSGRNVARLEFESGVEEIFDVHLIPGMRFPAVVGPAPQADGGETIWLVGSVASERIIRRPGPSA